MARFRLAVLGVGQIGSTFAYKLARAGHEVTVVARPGSLRLAQLRRDNGIVLKTGDHATVRVADELDEQTAYDLVVVTTRAHEAESLLPALARSKAQRVHFMSDNFNAERFEQAISDKRCTFGMPFVMALLDREGKLNPTIGSRQKTLHGDQRWVDLFNGAGIPSVFEPDMLLWLRCHTPSTVAVESAAIFSRPTSGPGFGSRRRALSFADSSFAGGVRSRSSSGRWFEARRLRTGG